MFLKLAWRNIWRNKRRSIITIASILFAVFFAVFMRSMQLGLYSKMIENMVGLYTGYIQIHSNGFWNEKTLDNSFENDERIISSVLDIKGVKKIMPRLEGFALSSYRDLTKGAMVVGIDPELENEMMKFSEKLTQGQLFSKDDKSIMIGKGLADYYGLGENDTLVLIGQGYHGVSASGKYSISGILQFSSPALNDNLIFLPLKEAQWFYGAENMITSYVLLIENNNSLDPLIDIIKQKIDIQKYEVMSWKEMLPELVQTIQADSAGGIIMLFILYMVISFGIFGTVLMMAAERMYEFGVLLSVGMRRWKIISVVVIETILMSAIGVVLGGITIFPLVFYFYKNPIELTGQAAEALLDYGFEAVIPASIDPMIILNHSIIIFIITILISIYPAIVVLRLQPVNAMRR